METIQKPAFIGLPGKNNKFKLSLTENSSSVQILQKVFFNDGCYKIMQAGMELVDNLVGKQEGARRLFEEKVIICPVKTCYGTINCFYLSNQCTIRLLEKNVKMYVNIYIKSALKTITLLSN